MIATIFKNGVVVVIDSFFVWERNNMGKIFITGHKNPDLDSICSAYAYSVLKNRIDEENEYIPVRPGHLSNSTKAILSALSIKAPVYMRNVYPKVSDVMLIPEEKFEADMPLTSLAKHYKTVNPSVIPIYDKGKFLGLLSVDDISWWFMHKLGTEGAIADVPKIRELLRIKEDSVQLTDLFEEAKSLITSFKKRGLAVFDGDEFAGYVTRRCFLKAPSYKVILVDHNEARQSIPGIETATIVEIVDHHRLDASKTSLPIFIDTEPVGSTCTIVYQSFLRHRIIPDEYTAKVMLTGLISDTLILKSPTTTVVDVNTAGALATICQVDINEFGNEMFSHVESLASREPKAAILSDFKKYTEEGVNMGIGQCEVTTLNDIEDYRDTYLEILENIREEEKLDWAVVMITNVLKEHSILLTTGFRSEKNLPYNMIREKVYDMPDVMSRKKQLLPEMVYALKN
ncbi:MAG: DHH family phosphoesterase [Lachnospiraceae bacterium]|nr:DHH family phosphoesterase [Lachnospiraceae bacterium]